MSFLLSLALFSAACFAQTNDPALRWTSIRDLGVEGQGWTETQHPFDRLPAKAEKMVRKPVWDLSHSTAGMSVRFSSASPTIYARWTLRSEDLALPHMPATGKSGLDLYVRQNGKWRWIANGRPLKKTNEQALTRDWAAGKRDYLLYLPLYNGVESVEIGVPTGETIEPGAARPKQVRPVLFYGSSITQGGCASRPGMVYTSIVTRALDWPSINLGFSGNGLSEPEMAQLLAELDPSVYVYDSLPNMNPEQVKERTEALLRTWRKAHPKTPIVLMESMFPTNSDLLEARSKPILEKNVLLKAIYQKMLQEGDKNLYYVPSIRLLGDDGEGTVDGAHPTDLGFLRMADSLLPVLRPLLQ